MLRLVLSAFDAYFDRSHSMHDLAVRPRRSSRKTLLGIVSRTILDQTRLVSGLGYTPSSLLLQILSIRETGVLVLQCVVDCRALPPWGG